MSAVATVPVQVVADWLLVGRCATDDIPLLLLKEATVADVIEAARGVTREEVLRVAREVFNLDTSEAICLTAVVFGRGRVPVRSETIEFQE